jgi:hypothetical protein
MNTIKFYGHFAAAFGSCWLLLFLCAFISQSRINLGEWGLLGPPVISAVYAYFRFKSNPQLERAIEKTGIWIDRQIGKFIKRKGNE